MTKDTSPEEIKTDNFSNDFYGSVSFYLRGVGMKIAAPEAKFIHQVFDLVKNKKDKATLEDVKVILDKIQKEQEKQS